MVIKWLFAKYSDSYEKLASYIFNLCSNKLVQPNLNVVAENLEMLNLFNNNLEDVPVSLSGMPKLRYRIQLMGEVIMTKD